MQVNLLSVVNTEGKSLPVDGVIDFSDKSEYGIDFFKPVHVNGKVTNIGGTLEFSGSIELEARFMCDRCGEWYEDTFKTDFLEILKRETEREESQENPDIIYYEGSNLDISEIILNNIFMNMPTKHLCTADCKGLCSVCGGNLNHSECSCKSEVTDPRFDVLDKFFDK